MLPGRKETLEVFVIKSLVFAVEGTNIAQLDERSQVFRAYDRPRTDCTLSDYEASSRRTLLTEELPQPQHFPVSSRFDTAQLSHA